MIAEGRRKERTIFSAVLFDLGQTLLDYGPASRWPEFRVQRSMELHPLAGELWGDTGLSAHEFGRIVGAGLQTDEFRATEHSGLSVPFRERLRQALTAIDIRGEDGALDRFAQAFVEPIRTWPKPYPEAQANLERLSSCGLSLAIITNSPWDTPGEPLYSDLERWGLRGFFAAFVGSGEVPWRKPNPRFMWAAAEALGVRPQACLVVGDNLRADVAGACAAGMMSVWVKRDAQATSSEAPRPDWTVGSLEEVPAIAGAALPQAGRRP